MTFHEDYRKEEAVKGSSDRAFGLTVGGIILIFAIVVSYFGRAVSITDGLLMLAGFVLMLFGLIKPEMLAPLNNIWSKLGHLLFKITNPVIMMVIYIFSVLPVGILMKFMKKDILALQFNDKESYWIKREPPGPPPENMTNQF